MKLIRRAGTWLVVAAALSAGTASAMLPPYYQAQSEIETVLKDSRVQKLFTSGRYITNVRHTRGGWEVRSHDCRALVKVERDNTHPEWGGHWVGPGELKAKVVRFYCNRNHHRNH